MVIWLHLASIEYSYFFLFLEVLTNISVFIILFFTNIKDIICMLITNVENVVIVTPTYFLVIELKGISDS
jgi:hypothetical protein